MWTSRFGSQRCSARIATDCWRARSPRSSSLRCSNRRVPTICCRTSISVLLVRQQIVGTRLFEHLSEELRGDLALQQSVAILYDQTLVGFERRLGAAFK